MKKLRVTVEGKAYEVLVEMLDEGTPAPAAPAAPAERGAPAAAAATPPPPAPAAPATPKPAAPAGAGDIVSPLAGKVVSIDVKVGDTVAEGGQVATIEAMKMNTYIYASSAGKVLSIHANIGDGVEEGALLVKIG
ncbi:MAG: acetyl-CoA carboxylase biotin carboxyl carrier protein subunit [Opitutaceae bacterium]|jgi:biotin carboxyl carrier protein|nr:acetyl-CoA carboxylase biotin carboxyl carrier protein subunit [Opitutaceae bacterium]